MILEGKTSIITGSSRGIGRAVALEFAREGSDVVVVGVSAVEAAHEVADKVRAMGKRAMVVMTDVTDKQQVETLVDITLKEFGKIDILVNNAGDVNMSLASFSRTTSEEWDIMLNSHIKGTVNCIQAVLNHMMERNSGKIINVVSLAGLIASPRMSAYGAAKGAIVSLTRTLAYELARYRINVNAIAPQAMTKAMDVMKSNQKLWDVIEKRYLLGMPSPEDIAPAYAFLASDKANYITGQILNVDGGSHIA